MDWKLDSVQLWIEDLEQRPRRTDSRDEYAKNINHFLNDCRRDGLWEKHRELCVRGQKAVVAYHNGAKR